MELIKKNGKWNPTLLPRENGEMVMMQTPQIVSASRSTDIPAFYSDWFFDRLDNGYCAWTNPFNGVRSYVSFLNTRFIVFWSKNPKPLLSYLDRLEEKKIGCYIQYTLNDYENDRLEIGVPKLSSRIETFKTLVEKLGRGYVIWRFDPLMLTEDIDISVLLSRIKNIGDQLKGYTEKLVFSFADIGIYGKVKRNLEDNHVRYKEWTKGDMVYFAQELVKLNEMQGWNYELATCAEEIDLEGVIHNHCIDDELIIRLAYQDKVLMDFLKVKILPMPIPNLFGDTEELPKDAILLPNNMYATHGCNKDSGQRKFCGCINAKDIGQYNTCVHLCEYCYANSSKAAAKANYQCHLSNPKAETITGK